MNHLFICSNTDLTVTHQTKDPCRLLSANFCAEKKCNNTKNPGKVTNGFQKRKYRSYEWDTEAHSAAQHSDNQQIKQ